MPQGDATTQLSAVQVRMARAAAGLTVRQLAGLTGLNKATIVRIEAGMSAQKSSFAAIRLALEEYGAEFHFWEDADNKIGVSFPRDAN